MLQDAFVSDPSTIVKNGQVVNVRVSSWDENASRLSLTMRLTTEGGANGDSNGTGLSDDGQARRNPRQGKVATSGNFLAAANHVPHELHALSVLAVNAFLCITFCGKMLVYQADAAQDRAKCPWLCNPGRMVVKLTATGTIPIFVSFITQLNKSLIQLSSGSQSPASKQIMQKSSTVAQRL